MPEFQQYVNRLRRSAQARLDRVLLAGTAAGGGSAGATRAGGGAVLLRPARAEEMRATWAREYPEGLARLRAEAEELLAGRARVFDREMTWTETPDWHSDPLTGGEWPRRFWAEMPRQERRPVCMGAGPAPAPDDAGSRRVPDRRAAVRGNGLPLAEELDRREPALHRRPLDQCPGAGTAPDRVELDLPAAAMSAGMDRKAGAGVLPADPTPGGVHPPELPGRLNSPSKHCSPRRPASPPPDWRSHGWPRRRWRDWGISAVGGTASAMPPGRRLRDQGVSNQAFVMDLLLQPVLLGGLPVPENSGLLLDRLEAMATCHAVIDASGALPGVGDGHEGAVVLLGQDLQRPHRSLLATCGVLFSRPEFCRAARVFDEKSAWLLGAGGRERFERLVGR